jgi:hypothetical protein
MYACVCVHVYVYWVSTRVRFGHEHFCFAFHPCMCASYVHTFLIDFTNFLLIISPTFKSIHVQMGTPLHIPFTRFAWFLAFHICDHEHVLHDKRALLFTDRWRPNLLWFADSMRRLKRLWTAFMLQNALETHVEYGGSPWRESRIWRESMAGV